MTAMDLMSAASLPRGFEINEVRHAPALAPAPAPGQAPAPPSLGPLAAFTGNFHGHGFNTIFRPNSPETPTTLPTAVVPISDNILELNLTSENLSFSPSLGAVPNRGMVEADAFLNGVPYLQAINDITTNPPTGIHLEPGLWVIVPQTTDPALGTTLVRMASIPHGTTICAEGTSTTFTGAPSIPPVDITPTVTEAPGAPLGTKIPFPSQTAANDDTARIPQDLTSFISAGTITQAMLTDPNSVLRDHNAGLTISGGSVLSISTSPAAPLFGGGTDNIASLLGRPQSIANPEGPGPNAQTLQMTAQFWISTVEHTIIVPIINPGDPPVTVRPEATVLGHLVPAFILDPPFPIPEPRPITVTSTQIQYSQIVMLNFNGLTWPHVSVATLVPAEPIRVPPSVWA